NVNIGAGDDRFERGPGRATRIDAVAAGGSVDGVRRKRADLFVEEGRVCAGRNADDAEMLGQRGGNSERLRADGTRGAEDGETQRDVQRSITHRTKKYSTGPTNNRLSSRSNTPPWPGIRRPMSFIPSRRLIRDSARSPISAATPTTSPSNAA